MTIIGLSFRDIFFFLHARGDPLPPSIPHKFDVILAADCVYSEPAFPLLVKTLKDLVPDKSVEVLFCYKKRRKVHFHLLELGDPIDLSNRSCAGG